MALINKHRAWLTFVRKALDVPTGFSKEDLWTFRQIAPRENPSLMPLIEDYLRLAENSETNARLDNLDIHRKRRLSTSEHVHLFDLLREEKFFPQNRDLARFASRVLPTMRAYRFDKMSRADIAGRIIEYLEHSDPKSRERLEDSMRLALRKMKRGPTRESERRTFLSRWEKIIKGIEF